MKILPRHHPQRAAQTQQINYTVICTANSQINLNLPAKAFCPPQLPIPSIPLPVKTVLIHLLAERLWSNILCDFHTMALSTGDASSVTGTVFTILGVIVALFVFLWTVPIARAATWGWLSSVIKCMICRTALPHRTEGV